jgi:MFS-type transporter involved in bile tolerance (Atg22 family)
VDELLKLTILLSNFDMERQWQGVIYVFILAAIGIIISHVYEESLLIIQVLVEFQTVVYLLEMLLADF